MSSCRDDREMTMGVEELFFSTTDRRGVIRQGNSVFVRVSGFSREELSGAPHNIVRHPDMPGGAFRLVWDRLDAGWSVGAYVKNLTRDGRPYWVFATMSPVRDGYLSVRMAARARLLDVAEQVYAQAARAERETPMSRRDAALHGMAHIEESLRRHGFASYDAFMFDALPAELSARSHLVSTSYARPGASGRIGEVLAGAATVDELLDGLVGHLSAYGVLCERLATTSANVLDISLRMSASVAAAQRASETVAGSAPVLANVARVMDAPMRKATAALERMRTRLDEVRADVAELRFRISLARLYNTTAAAFAAEVADGAAPSGSLGAVPLLCDAAESGSLEMSAQVRRVNDGLRAVAALVGEARDLMEEFRRFLGQWRNLVLRHRAGAAIADLLDPIDAEIDAGWDWIETLHDLGHQARTAVISFDPELLRTRLSGMRLAPAAA
ncbi:PAS domain-containing protein [Actinomadura harenae]|uniref:PAS domain-containing protein n=1 Tax=Actinomadura harenae TaxID=2483351 RepID=UPI001F215F84|nr:PAS domain-containing protein [Actinomadura harenae]